MTDFVVCEVMGHAGVIWIDRPRALNALSLEMIVALTDVFDDWVHDDRIKHIVLRARSDSKAFCAGGDIRAVHDAGLKNPEQAGQFFSLEYGLNGFLKRYPKPIISLIDGYCMGGGMGLSMHGSYRIGTERAIFAMPESKIGFFTDVGMTHFLSRLPNGIGFFLGMTGVQFGAALARELGFLTHTVFLEQLEDVFALLCSSQDCHAVLNTMENPAFPRREQDIFQEWLREFGGFCASDLGAVLFSLGFIDGAFEFLDCPNTNLLQTWFDGCCPLSVCAIHRALCAALHQNFEQCLSAELHLAKAFLNEADFFEGVSALLIDKGRKPLWRLGYDGAFVYKI